MFVEFCGVVGVDVPPPIGISIDPPADYRSMPLWVWNDEMDAKRIDEMLAQYKQQGLGGAFVHPRPGLMTEYLGADWFKLWRHSLNEGKRLGLDISIYDENSYPSGFAGGHVPAQAPDTAAQYVVPEFGVDPNSVTAHPLTVAFVAMEKDAAGNYKSAHRVASPTEVRPGEVVAAFRLRRASGNPWTGEFPYVDLTNPRTAPKFLETTYEAYKREFGSEFGKTIKWAFTDEPLLATAGAYDSGPATATALHRFVLPPGVRAIRRQRPSARTVSLRNPACTSSHPPPRPGGRPARARPEGLRTGHLSQGTPSGRRQTARCTRRTRSPAA